jgi:RNA polymerase sigma-70 factor, ECF subfamily
MSRDSDKFIELLKPVYSDVVRYCRAMCRNGNPDDAEDILQNTLVKGYEKLYMLNDETKFKNWIFSIATREHKTFLRSHFWKRFLPLAGAHHEYGETPVYDRSDDDYDKKVLYHALSELNEKERAAILLFEIGGFSIRDIMEIQNEKSESTVKSRLSRTRDKLKSSIEKAEEQNTKLNPAEGDIQNETLKIISELERKEKRHGQILG